jgi:hypothetical protein
MPVDGREDTSPIIVTVGDLYTLTMMEERIDRLVLLAKLLGLGGCDV